MKIRKGGDMQTISAFQAARESYAALYSHRLAFLKVVAPIAVVVALFDWMQATSGRNGGAVATVFIEIVIAFYWHRVFLLGGLTDNFWGKHKNADGSADTSYYRKAFTPFMWRSFGLLGVLLIAVLIVALPFYQFIKDEAVFTISIAATILFIIIGPLFFRSALVFPAVAIGSPDVTLSGAWALSKGQGLRILGAYVLTAVSMLSVVFGIDFLLPVPVIGSVAFYIDLLFGAVVTCVSTAVWAGVNSSIYRQLGAEISDFLDSNTVNQSAAEQTVSNER